MNKNKHLRIKAMKLTSSNSYVPVILIAFLLSFFAAGCAVLKKQPTVTKKPALLKISFSEYPEFADDMAYDSLELSIRQSISYLKKIPPTRKFRFGEDSFDAVHMIRSLEHFLNYIQNNPSKKDLKKFIASNYLVYRSVGCDKLGQVLFTGYYEPVLKGSLNKNDVYNVPVYSRPADLISIDLSPFTSELKGKKIIGRYTGHTVVPYYDRMKIESEDIFQEKSSPLAWVKDPVDLFFLQIQGSGKIYLDNANPINVHYHTTNGRPYRSIGKFLIEKGKISRLEMSMQKIREYLRDHPHEVRAILNYNPSYVFFKIEKDGPLGCIEVQLTPGRSIALDRRIFPMSALAFIETQKPLIDGNGHIHRWTDFSRFVLNHDTGGAIKGPGRADLFWGNGTYAEIAAGYMQHTGMLYFLILKPRDEVLRAENMFID